MIRENYPNEYIFSVKNLTEICISAILKAKNSFVGVSSRVTERIPAKLTLNSLEGDLLLYASLGIRNFEVSSQQ